MSKNLYTFLLENNVDLNDMKLLGSGENGTAWHSRSYVVKQTSSKWEYDFAVKQLTGEWPLFAKIYGCFENGEHYFYVAEYLQKNDEINKLFALVDTMLASQWVDPSESWKFDYEKFCTEYNQNKARVQRAMNIAAGNDKVVVTPKLKPISDAVENFYFQMLALSLEYKRIGASDMHEGNLGYDSNGHLKAFDIDLDTEDKEEIIFKKTGKVSMY